jgi:hypothetical protein
VLVDRTVSERIILELTVWMPKSRKMPPDCSEKDTKKAKQNGLPISLYGKQQVAANRAIPLGSA